MNMLIGFQSLFYYDFLTYDVEFSVGAGVFAFLSISTAFMGDGVDAQSLPYFGACDSRFWLTQGSRAPLNLADSSANPFKFTDLGDVSFPNNGNAFNLLDNYGCEVRQDCSPDRYRVDANGQAENRSSISRISSGFSVSSGEITDHGSYYVYGGTHPNRLYKIVIRAVSATSMTLSRSIRISDRVWPNRLLYAKEKNTSRLVSIDPATGFVTNVEDTGLSPSAVSGSGNAGRGFNKFNTTTGRATRTSSAPGASTNAGIKCATSRLRFAADITISRTDEQEANKAGGGVVYEIVVANNGIFDATSIAVSDPLPAGITTASWTCTGAGGGQCSNANGTGAISGELAKKVSFINSDYNDLIAAIF